jgi:14-3-3 protein epsilon
MSDMFAMAKISNTAERYEDMCHYMRTYVQELVNDGIHLTDEERTFLDIAYKRVSGSLRTVLEMLSDASGFDEHKKEAQMKLSLVCHEILEILEKTLIPAAEKDNNMDLLVCYRTMAGDYHRYLIEITPGSVEQSGKYYAIAYLDAQRLSHTSVARLGVANNYSVYCYEVLKDTKRACHISQTASDGASAELNTFKGPEYEECLRIVRVLVENRKLWSSKT